MPIKLNSAGGGSVSIDVPSTGSTYTLTAPAKTGNLITSADSGTVTQTMLSSGVAGNGPCFSAYNSSSTTIPNNAWTKVGLQSEEFDTANCFDSSSNYRFTPNVAGYYQFSSSVQLLAPSTFLLSFYKNGTEFKRGMYTYSASTYGTVGSALIYLNGSTDYVELYCYNAGSSQGTQTGAPYTFLTGFLARAA